MRIQRSCTLRVPARIANAIHPDQQFECHVSEEGILYRPVNDPKKPLPSWVNTATRK